MILERFDSVVVIGIYISPNMPVDVLVAKMNEGLNSKPELSETFGVLMNSLSVLDVLNTQITSKITTIIAFKSSLKSLKRALEIAVKAYNVGSALSMKLMDLKPVVNGSPLATGADAALTPLKVGVETATSKLQDAEDSLDTATTELIDMTSEFEKQYSKVVDQLMSKIAELGNKNIEV